MKATRVLPAGTVTLLFTDIEGSTRLLHEVGDRYAHVLAEHRRALRQAFGRHGGVEVDTQGDAFFYAFADAAQAVAAAADAQRALAGGPVRVRIGIHSGQPTVTSEGYVGVDVHHGARLMSVGHGGQVLLSGATRDLVDGEFELTDLGAHRLKDLAEPVWIFQLGDGKFPSLKTISNTNLPRPASSFVGRERELHEIVSRLDGGARLLTLTGPGGSGKTRLALEAAASLVPRYKHGVYWIGLAPLRDPALVGPTIAETLGAKTGLAEHVGERAMLVLLDNFEQVIDAAPKLSSLVEHCPNLALVVTSRELLRVQGEIEYPVPPLDEGEAVRLFCERAQTDRSEDVARLCRRLDHLPLAVELAAARAKALSPGQILERLAQRLDLLIGRRDAEPRQQTLRATIEWSHDLLDDDEQRLFRRLSAFAGGCTLEAAEAVCDADVDTLQSLVEKSLVRFTNGRYWMLETIRQYGAEALDRSGEADAVRTRHLRWCRALAEQAEPELRTREQRRFVALLKAEHDNLREALSWGIEGGRRAAALDLAAKLWFFWYLRGYYEEGRRFLQRARGLDPSADGVVGAQALLGLAVLSSEQGGHREGEAFARQALELFRAADDDEGTAYALTEIAANAALREDVEQARALLDESLSMLRRTNDRWTTGVALWKLGWLDLAGRDYERAASRFEECVALYRELEEPGGTGYALFGVGAALVGAGIRAGARARFAEALELAREVEFPALAISCVEGIAAVGVSDDAEFATRLLTVAAVERHRVGAPRDRPLRDLADRARATAVAALGHERVALLEHEARDVRLDDVVADALAQGGVVDGRGIAPPSAP